MKKIDITTGSSAEHPALIEALAALPEADRAWLEAVRLDHLRRMASDQRQGAGGREARTEQLEDIVRRAIHEHLPQLNAPARLRRPRSRQHYLLVKMQNDRENYGYKNPDGKYSLDGDGEIHIPGETVIERIVKEAEDQGILNQNAATHRK